MLIEPSIDGSTRHGLRDIAESAELIGVTVQRAEKRYYGANTLSSIG
jgi:hypothetical protein